MNDYDVSITQISECTFPTPLKFAGRDPSAAIRYRQDADRVRVFPCLRLGEDDGQDATFERAGPREFITGDPSQMTAAILTCGGLCPGLNDVIRGLVMSLSHHYGVRKILGIRYGYAGLATGGHPPVELTPETVDDIHRDGGTILGVSRGKQDVPAMARTLLDWGVDQLFVIGGDGTQRGALELSEEFERLGAPIAVIGIPKTIDNDILWVDQSFGFDTAMEIASRVVNDAHVEARSAERCVGVVKVMGRDSGYIAAYAALASLEANLVLVPEVPFSLDDKGGLLDFLEERIQEKDHAVIVVAEGAGQEHFENAEAQKRDASGNRLHRDIGDLLCDKIRQYFNAKQLPVNLKYLDPSYSVRSAPACSTDRIYCTRLAHSAVHAAMAGKTGMMVSRWTGHYVHVPLGMVTQGRRKIDPTGSLWRTVLESTGQPCLSNGKPK
ncbi:ATP-dependent 6-phosphofructokinase [Pontiella sulfatireligans]|uniref:ATP-dependent 6-phosphofructokinase n=1 Tax=Pontiella sulfatireligans TaxID=2750658 RepID=A0A6C2UIC5_9BACT|nr:ATP-dependent 6-phosphofructokinase [Pontiella sulfatireligans]VGO19709.1 ATP-dependent 6-phosphofructokinase [Pontiella sulfatireligans]